MHRCLPLIKTEEVSFLSFMNVDPQRTPALAPPTRTLRMDKMEKQCGSRVLR
jgi:hypothetical protein